MDLRLAPDPGLHLHPVDLEATAGLHRAVPVVPAGRAVLRPVGRVVLLDLLLTRRRGLVRPVGLDPAVPVVPDRQDLVAPARLVSLGLTDLVGRAVLLDLAHRAVPGLMGRVSLAVLAVPGLMGPVSLADPGGRVDPVDPVDRVDPGDRAGLGRMDPVDPVAPRRSRIGPEVSTIAAVPSLAAPGTRRTASAHPTMARRLHPRNAGSAGMTDPLPEGLRPTGMGRRLRAVGTVLRLPVVGTVDGTGRHAT